MTTIKSDKPPYLLGLLGLIPIVGAIVGIALILYGIIRYKDKWLAVIGAGCILFTIVIFFSFYSLYSFSKSPTLRKEFIGISERSINSLCRSIEFYKIEHGSFPDSLRQLTEDAPFSPINDPVAVWGSGSTLYNYKHLGDKYLLFSSGVDGIQNTEDDIYPTINFDSSKFKFGFVLKQ